MENNWHIPEISALEKRFNTDISEGLSAREARSRLEKEKKREKGYRKSLFVANRSPIWKALLSFAGAPFAVLLAIMSLLMVIIASSSGDQGGFLVGISVLTVTLAATVFGGILNHRARRKLEDMREFASPMVKVKRGGIQMYTDGRNLVRGDVIYLAAGDLLPCDARLIRCDGLTVEELVASEGGIGKRRVRKNADAVYNDDLSVKCPDAENMLYAGSAIVGGKAIALVCATDSDVYLADYMTDGALGGRDLEPEGVKNLRPVCYKISFIAASALLILSLVGLLTLRGKESFICVFTMLLAAISFLTVELPINGAIEIVSSFLRRLSERKKKGKDRSAAVRNVKALDTLCGVTDLVLVGTAGLGEGSFRITSAYTQSGVMTELTPDTPAGNRLLNVAHTYVKALRESGYANAFVENGYLDAISSHLRSCGFDINGASLAIKSLYFASDANAGNGYACAETDREIYRTSLFFEDSLFEKCMFIRDGASIRGLYEDDLQNITVYRKNANARGAKCLYAVSEQDGKMVFEGLIALEQFCDSELANVAEELKRMNIRATVLLGREGPQTARLIAEPALAPLFDGEIAYASAFVKEGRKITDGVGHYSAYVGFSADAYSELILYLRRKGSKVAAYGICNDYNPIMACADIAISCDVVNYASDKYKESVYEKMPPEGRETNVRCSQQTRLLSKVIIRRYHEYGGGASSILNALKTARSAYVSMAYSVLLFVLLMTPLLIFSAVSVLTGNLLLDPLQTAALASVTAIFSMTVFTEIEVKDTILAKKRDFTAYPIILIRENFAGIVARASLTLAFSIAIKVLDVLAVFGDAPTYTLPVFICVVFTGFAEVFLLTREFTKKGEGRANCWLKVMIAYAILLAVCAVSTQRPFLDEFFANGIGGKEFFLVPAYVALYVVTLLVLKLVRKRSK